MTSYVEYQPQGAAPFDPHAILTVCFEHDARGLLLDEHALPAAFFDLSTGLAGALVQRLSMYGFRMAGVVADPARHSRAFQDFVREANKGKQVRFFRQREDAIQWLESE